MSFPMGRRFLGERIRSEGRMNWPAHRYSIAWVVVVCSVVLSSYFLKRMSFLPVPGGEIEKP